MFSTPVSYLFIRLEGPATHATRLFHPRSEPMPSQGSKAKEGTEWPSVRRTSAALLSAAFE
jgi:hypothetical protein